MHVFAFEVVIKNIFATSKHLFFVWGGGGGGNKSRKRLTLNVH